MDRSRSYRSPVSSLASHLPTIQLVKPVHPAGAHPSFVAGDEVAFALPTGEVRARVIGVDAKAHRDLPHGVPYRLHVLEAPPQSGYAPGSDCTIRAACLVRTGHAPPLPAAAPARPMFLVAWMREGGTNPMQGVVLVQGDSLEAASASAMASLQAELEADVRERGESAEAMVLLLNASEVPADAFDRDVVASVSW